MRRVRWLAVAAFVTVIIAWVLAIFDVPLDIIMVECTSAVVVAVLSLNEK